MRRLRAFLALAALAGAAAASASAGGSTPPVLLHPNPLLTNITLDYMNPIPAPGGGWATLAPLEPGVIEASLRDMAYLRYTQEDDWGGFGSPPLGSLSLEDGGAVILGGRQKPGVEFYKSEGGGQVTSWTPLGGGSKGNGTNPHTHQPPLPNRNPVPCANSGFGGTSCGGRQGGNGKSGGNTSKGHGRGSNARGDCGTAGLSITSDLRHCRIDVVNQAPGDGTFEHLTIENTSSSSYTLSLQASGSSTLLWGSLELGVWHTGSSAPTPLPPLRFWTTQFTQLGTLAPGQTIHLTIELYLPSTAGNKLQRKSAVIDFNWRAT